MMRQKVINKTQDKNSENGSSTQCPHFWVIDAAYGPTSQGVCKYCGQKKEFFNIIPNPLIPKRNTNPLQLPDLPEVDIDEGSQS